VGLISPKSFCKDSLKTPKKLDRRLDHFEINQMVHSSAF